MQGIFTQDPARVVTVDGAVMLRCVEQSPETPERSSTWRRHKKDLELFFFFVSNLTSGKA